MKVEELTVDIKANLTVDESTANACLKLVEIYVNSTGKNVIVDKKDYGELSFEFEE